MYGVTSIDMIQQNIFSPLSSNRRENTSTNPSVLFKFEIYTVYDKEEQTQIIHR